MGELAYDADHFFSLRSGYIDIDNIVYVKLAQV